jgi:CDP-diacylglycerol--glycerol-3-phosphate 3-phosphatidyltransferase
LKNKLKKKIPNTITTIRLFLAFVFPLIYILGYKALALGIFVLAATSDFIDGYLARRWKVVSEYGKKIDPIADKSLSGFALMLIAYYEYYFMISILIFEFLIAYNSIKKYSHFKHFYVSKIGKFKTVVLFLTISIALLSTIIKHLQIPLYLLVITTIILQLLSLKSYIITPKD